MTIKERLEKIYEELDEIQETTEVQENDELMWEIGEAMGSVDNAIDVIDNPTKTTDLDQLAREIDRHFTSATLYKGNDCYVEVRYDSEIDDMRELIEKLGFEIDEDQTGYYDGSDYEAYYIYIK